MSALLGKPAGQLLGHSLPALLGGHAELGRVLLEKQPFNSLEMELTTPRGTRWISIAGDPIVDTAGRFEGFRGVGSDITEIRQTQERLTHLANVDVLSGPSQPRPGPPAARRGAARGDHRQCAVRDHVPRPRRLQAGQRHLRPPQGRRGASRRRQAARRRSRRRRDHVGRMGGDEFAIVIADAQSRRKVEKLADRIIQAIKEPYVDRSDRDPHRRLDRLRLRPDRRRDGRRSDPQGRPCALSGEGRRPRLRALFLVGAAVGAGGPGPPRIRPSQRDRVEAVPSRLPAADQRQDPEADRVRGADPLESPAARLRPAQRVHSGRRGNRPDAGRSASG